MRPVNKGTSPQIFTKYVDARDPLIDRIGDYCSYCERPCDPHIEHIEPQSKHPNRALDWDNFLLGCVYCNTIKNDTFVGASTYYFPDEKNTAFAFIYNEASNEVEANPLITDPTSMAVCDNTIALVGLNRRFDSLERPDRRWRKRADAWGVATRAYKRHCENPPIDAKDVEAIVALALATGFFSAWLTAFANIPSLCTAIIAAFAGTRPDCYDPATGLPVPDLNR